MWNNCTGLFTKNGDHVTERIESKAKGPARLIEIRDKVLNFCTEADLIIIEGYAFTRTNQAHQVGELGGVLRVMFVEQGFDWIEVSPGQLKKFACGKASAKKEEVILGTYKRWGVEFGSNDECDAYVLARIGQAMFSLINVKKYFKSDEEKIQEVVDSMRMIEMIWGREAAAKKGIITSFLICSAYIFFYLFGFIVFEGVHFLHYLPVFMIILTLYNFYRSYEMFNERNFTIYLADKIGFPATFIYIILYLYYCLEKAGV